MCPIKLILVIMLVFLHLRKVKLEETKETFFLAEYPDKIYPHATYVITVSVPEYIPHKVDLAVSLNIIGQEVVSEPIELEPGSSAKVTFESEDLAGRDYEIKIVGQMLEKTSTLIDTISTVLSPSILLVQANKHEYKPGESIHFLFGVLDEYLRPMEVDTLHTFLQSPEKVYVLKNEVTQDGSGLFFSQYVIPAEAPQGDWSVLARYSSTLRKADYFKVSDGNSSKENEFEKLNSYIHTMKSLIKKITADSHAGEKITPEMIKSASETMEKLENKIPVLHKIGRGDHENEKSLSKKLQEKEERILLLEKTITEIKNEKNSSFLVRGLPVIANGEITLQQQVSEYFENTLKLKDVPIKSIRSLSSKFSLTTTLRVKVDNPETVLRIMTAQSSLTENDTTIKITEDDSDYSCEQECDHIYAETKRGFRSKLKNRRGKVHKKQKVPKKPENSSN